MYILDFGKPCSSSSIISTVTTQLPKISSLVTVNSITENTIARNPLTIKLKISSGGSMDPLGQVDSLPIAVSTNLVKAVRSKPRCQECGHCLYSNVHKLKQRCPIPVERRLPKCTCDEFNAKRKKPSGFSHYCEKTRCLLECCRQTW